MRVNNSEWFECKVCYDQMQDNGSVKKVKELYTVDALSFTESETRIIDEMAQFISGEYEVTDMKKAKYKEIYFSENDDADIYYQVKIKLIFFDEKTEKEKASLYLILVQSNSLQQAVKDVEEIMKGSLSDYRIAEIKETNIVDVIEHKVEG